MCGIAGFHNLSHVKQEAGDYIHACAQALAHRGPDGQGLWQSADQQTTFIHRRLSIIDLSAAGAQPMMDQEKTVVVIYNGEIYNHLELRSELELLGHRYHSQTDTETIIHAYKQWGIDAIKKFEGMFAFALFDIQKNELYLVRDQIGIKPLYFSLHNDVLSFASEIKALWTLPWIEKELNVQGLYHYLTYLVTPAPMTLYKGIYKLPAGFYVKVDAKKNATFHEWYNPLVPSVTCDAPSWDDEQACVERIRAMLRSSVQKQMMSDVPLGVFLSGGIDSSLNVALMSEFTSNVKTFNVSFSDGPEWCEREWARKVARHFNTEHHEIVISEKEAFQFFERMVYHQDEPLGDCVCVPLYFVSKLLKDSGVTVVQVGEGSDELFCGYQHYTKYLELYPYWSSLQKMAPAFVRKGLYQLAKPFVTHHNHRDKLKNWAENKSFFWSGAVAFSETWKQQLWHLEQEQVVDPIIEKIYPSFHADFSSYDVVDYHMRILQQHDPHADFFKTMTYLELKQRLPELLLMRVDKMTMATSVESRVPFLNHQLVEYALQMPTKFKYKNGVTKYILKKVCEGILPRDIIYRNKVGFAAPTKRWFKEGVYFKPYFNDLLETKKNKLHDYIDVNAVKTLWKKNQASGTDYSLQLWVLQNVMAMDLL